jgi:hypothetical protein
MMNFKEKPLIRKLVVCTFFVAVALFAFFDFAGLFGLTITITVIYLIIKLIYNLFNPQPVLQRQESDDEYRDRCQQDDDDYTYIKEEEERVNQENIANQEALDRLL